MVRNRLRHQGRQEEALQRVWSRARSPAMAVIEVNGRNDPLPYPPVFEVNEERARALAEQRRSPRDVESCHRRINPAAETPAASTSGRDPHRWRPFVIDLIDFVARSLVDHPDRCRSGDGRTADHLLAAGRRGGRPTRHRPARTCGASASHVVKAAATKTEQAGSARHRLTPRGTTPALPRVSFTLWRCFQGSIPRGRVSFLWWRACCGASACAATEVPHLTIPRAIRADVAPLLDYGARGVPAQSPFPKERSPQAAGIDTPEAAEKQSSHDLTVPQSGRPARGGGALLSRRLSPPRVPRRGVSASACSIRYWRRVAIRSTWSRRRWGRAAVAGDPEVVKRIDVGGGASRTSPWRRSESVARADRSNRRARAATVRGGRGGPQLILLTPEPGRCGPSRGAAPSR